MPPGGVGEGVKVGTGHVGVLVGGLAAAAGLDIGAETSSAKAIVTVASTAKSRRITGRFISMLLSLIETFPISGRYELHLNAALRRSLAGMRSAALHSIGVRRAHLGPLPAPILDFADATYRYFTPE